MTPKRSIETTAFDKEATPQRHVSTNEVVYQGSLSGHAAACVSSSAWLACPQRGSVRTKKDTRMAELVFQRLVTQQADTAWEIGQNIPQRP